jgi:hypothetical protein
VVPTIALQRCIVDDQPTRRGRGLLAAPGQAVRRRHAGPLARATMVAGVGAVIVSPACCLPERFLTATVAGPDSCSR